MNVEAAALECFAKVTVFQVGKWPSVGGQLGLLHLLRRPSTLLRNGALVVPLELYIVLFFLTGGGVAGRK